MPQTSRATVVPIFSPATTRAMLPSTDRLNTIMSMSLSRHRLTEVASATLRPRVEELVVAELVELHGVGVACGSES